MNTHKENMVKSKNRQHGFEHIILNNDDDELWEIDYDYGMAVNVSEYMKMNLVNTEIIKYSGSIKDFLEKERSCSNVQLHEDMIVCEKFHETIWTFDS